MSGAIGTVLRAAGLENARWVASALQLRRKLTRIDQKLCERYLESTREPKLQIGGGWHRLDGWLNTDLGLLQDIVRMDATKPFPFAAETFAYVYTEHMIEHVPYEQGVFMLRECHRVMRRGGTIRVVTPDLAAITGLLDTELDDIQRAYVAWFGRAFLPDRAEPTPAHVVNAFLQMWGHQFVYDEATLTRALQEAGFASVRRPRLHESEHAPLRGLENIARYPPGLLEFESVALEAVK